MRLRCHATSQRIRVWHNYMSARGCPGVTERRSCCHSGPLFIPSVNNIADEKCDELRIIPVVPKCELICENSMIDGRPIYSILM